MSNDDMLAAFVLWLRYIVWLYIGLIYMYCIRILFVNWACTARTVVTVELPLCFHSLAHWLTWAYCSMLIAPQLHRPRFKPFKDGNIWDSAASTDGTRMNYSTILHFTSASTLSIRSQLLHCTPTFQTCNISVETTYSSRVIKLGITSTLHEYRCFRYVTLTEPLRT